MTLLFFSNGQILSPKVERPLYYSQKLSTLPFMVICAGALCGTLPFFIKILKYKNSLNNIFWTSNFFFLFLTQRSCGILTMRFFSRCIYFLRTAVKPKYKSGAFLNWYWRVPFKNNDGASCKLEIMECDWWNLLKIINCSDNILVWIFLKFPEFLVFLNQSESQPICLTLRIYLHYTFLSYSRVNISKINHRERMFSPLYSIN